MERELLMAGIGGQGIQLAAQLIATALADTGGHVQLFGSYSGMMRGGATEATLVASDGDPDIQCPPTVSSAWSAIITHDAYAAGVLTRLRPGGLLVVNSSLCRSRPPAAAGVSVVEVPAADLVLKGGPPAATMAMVGAYSRATGLVCLDALVAALPKVLPPYRQRHVPASGKALSAGYEATSPGQAPAWAHPATTEATR
ncbi:2-oxoacid:acceptor oxidoreductase family protein [Streptomyces sp. NPDC126514]|uniref:2-oxoacid:acceptor oxidoreductase family protein n=1 Tax=Streptomyces sp. NPDC126514 TaxID=3155210 RepID=UPI003316D0D2